ncbi:MAG: T9SS type A sorting domain-containing protein [Cytophagaceae bacterium]
MRIVIIILSLLFAQLLLAQPANDECSGAILLTPSTTCTNVNGTIQGATRSTITTGCSSYGDVFYKFVAGSPSATINVKPETGLNLVVGLFDACGTSSSIICKDGAGYGGLETITLTNFIPGNTYYIKIGSNVSSYTKYAFTVCVVSSPNDECIFASTITPTANCNSSITGSLLEATTSTVTTSCGGFHDVFYKFVANASAVRIRTSPNSTSLDLMFSVYTNCSGDALYCVDETSAGAVEVLLMEGLTTGTTYYIKVASKNQDPPGKTFGICVQNAPANDHCSNATSLTPSSSCSNLSGTLDVSTVSSMSSSCPSEKDVFYKFVASVSSTLIKVTPSAGLDVVVGVFTACDGAALTCANEQAAGGIESINLTGLTIGTTYFIKVASAVASPSTNTFTICMQNSPSNDECSAAIALISGSTTCNAYTGTLNVANTSALSNACSGYNDVFFKFTASASTATITVSPEAGLDVTVGVFKECTDQTSLSCVNEAGAGGTENVYLSSLTSGAVYIVKIASASVQPSAHGFTVCVKNPPANDECANAININPSVGYFPTAGNLREATTSATTTNCGGFNDVFFKFTANNSSPTITVEPQAGLDVMVGIYTSCSSSTPLACVNNAGNGLSEVIRLSNLTTTNVYYIKVSSVEASPSVTSFNIVVQNPPSNDNCSGAFNLNFTSTCTPGNATLANATNSSITSPSCVLYNDVFYSFTANTYAASIRVVPSSGLDAVVSLYDACDGALISCVNTGGLGVTEVLNTNKLVSGNNYRIQVGSSLQSPASNTFTICVHSQNNDEKEFSKPLTSTVPCDNNFILDNGTQSPGKMVCDNSTDPMFNYKHDLWYTFVAVSTKYNITASREASNSFGVELQDEAGTSLLCERASVKMGGGPSSTVVSSISTLTIGNTYYIRIGKDGLGGYNELFKLCATPVNIPTGLQEDKTNNNLFAYPNPATISLTVHSSLSGKQSVELLNYNGNRVLKSEFDKPEFLLDLEKIPEGVYLLLISDNDGNQLMQKVSVVK